MATWPIRPKGRSGAGEGRGAIPWLAVVLAWGVLVGRAGAQAPTVDTSVPALPGGVGSSLGPSPGAGNSALGPAPGAGGSVSVANLPTAGILGGRPGPFAPKGVPATVTTPGVGPGPTVLQAPITAPQPQPVGPTTTPFFGSLDLPATEYVGPPDGLTLEQAIDVTLDRSLDLRQKFVEIPMARADELQASLRANPVFYQDGQLLQYTRGEFNRARPGGPQQFDTNVVYPLDISQKRLARKAVAARAVRVLEAQFQDAVRSRIDDVYGAFVAALNARQTLLYAERSVEVLGLLQERTERLYQAKQASLVERDRAENQFRIARLGLYDARASYRKARLDLGSLMNLGIEEATKLEIRGQIIVEAPPPPPIEELRRIALAERPDILTFRLGVTRAQADVRLARANAYSDVYVLWQPYTFQDNSPYGVKSATSWALGVTVPLPIYNRNQGGILRARMNVDQSRLQLEDIERQTLIDIEEAVQEYEVSRRLVIELHDEVIPDAKEMRNQTADLYRAGSVSVIELINAQSDLNDKVKQYLDTAIRYRRSMLALNTVVGKRIMP
jgi:cobalt-zinc-cadmium efflux system outer membrane protein